MFNKLSNKELVSVTHDLAKTLGADIPLLDIAKLLAESATRLDVAIARGNELQRKVEDTETLMLAMRDDSRESRSKLELVVAENAALKGGIFKCTEAVENWNSWADAEDKITLHTETPATDAMVNEIRAEGVELFASAIQGGCAVGDRVKDLADEFANQLLADAAKDGE